MTVWSDIERVRSVDKYSVSRLRLAPGVRNGFISDARVETAMMQLAADGSFESRRWQEIKDSNGSWVGGVERRVLKRRSSHRGSQVSRPAAVAIREGEKTQDT